MKITMIGWIWIIFIVIFILMAVYHFIESGKKISKFQISVREMDNVTVRIAGSEIDEPLRNFATDFNMYIDNYNNSTSKQQKIAGFGFIVAALIALLSLFLELKIIK